MKPKLFIVILAVFFFTACCKDDIADVMDCAGDALLTSVDHDASDGNPREVTFTVIHGDNPEIGSVDWNFGDGRTQTSNSPTITHTYAEAGSYQVSLKVHLVKSCSFDKTKNVTVP